MSYFGSTDWFQRASAGEVPGVRVIQNVGFRTVGTTLEAINSSGFYRTPPVPVALEIVSDSAADSAAGLGARSVRIVGLDENWLDANELAVMDGTTPVPLSTNFVRTLSVDVEGSGVYAEAALGSHVGTITIQEVVSGDVWTEIPNSPHPMGRALISSYTVPLGKVGFVSSVTISADTNKTVNVAIAFREQADVIVAPFGPRRTVVFSVGIAGPITLIPRGLLGPVAGPADIVILAQAESGMADVTVDSEILTVDAP